MIFPDRGVQDRVCSTPMSRRGLLGRLGSKRPSEQISDVESIVAHLRDLLNTSVGDSPCAQGFGIIDFVDLVHDFPGAVQILQRSIRKTIREYEPRLQNVSVKAIDMDDPMMLSFEISARLTDDSRGGLIRLRTEMNSAGRMEVY